MAISKSKGANDQRTQEVMMAKGVQRLGSITLDHKNQEHQKMMIAIEQHYEKELIKDNEGQTNNRLTEPAKFVGIENQTTQAACSKEKGGIYFGVVCHKLEAYDDVDAFKNTISHERFHFFNHTFKGIACEQGKGERGALNHLEAYYYQITDVSWKKSSEFHQNAVIENIRGYFRAIPDKFTKEKNEVKKEFNKILGEGTIK